MQIQAEERLAVYVGDNLKADLSEAITPNTLLPLLGKTRKLPRNRDASGIGRD